MKLYVVEDGNEFYGNGAGLVLEDYTIIFRKNITVGKLIDMYEFPGSRPVVGVDHISEKGRELLHDLADYIETKTELPESLDELI